MSIWIPLSAGDRPEAERISKKMFGTNCSPFPPSSVKAIESKQPIERRRAMNRMMSLVSRQQDPQEVLQAKVEHLEEWVRELLVKNQILRMALLAERARAQSNGHSRNLTTDPMIG
jgi:hypothetical protein